MAEFQGAFNDADIVLVTPVYPAGEEPIAGVTNEALVEGLKQRGHLGAHAASDPHDVARLLAGIAAPGDMIIFLGAGDITKWAAGFAEGLAKARSAV
jgi:UDP-N-acetylmuramate--alanine ligase